jgi:hypothetical protein
MRRFQCGPCRIKESRRLVLPELLVIIVIIYASPLHCETSCILFVDAESAMLPSAHWKLYDWRTGIASNSLMPHGPSGFNYTWPCRVLAAQDSQQQFKCLMEVKPTLNVVGLEVLTAVIMKSTIFWDVTPCSPSSVNRSFGETYRLHLQGRKISRARN